MKLFHCLCVFVRVCPRIVAGLNFWMYINLDFEYNINSAKMQGWLDAQK